MEPSRSDAQPHSELVKLPASLENIDAKMNHLIVRVEVGIKASERAERTAEKARELAESARNAARNSGSIAVKAVQGIDSLPWKQRILATAGGSVLGGAVASTAVWVAVFIAMAAGCHLPGR